MSKKPGRGGTGGGSKQRPQRPQRPAASGSKTKKPAKPAVAAHPHHHVTAGSGGSGRAKKGKARQTHHTHHRGTKRGFSTGICSCAAEALGMSLRLAGFGVTDHDVLDLYYLTANYPDEGATIAATLSAAAGDGLAGIRLASYREVMPGDDSIQPERVSGAGLVLGINVPGPHTVLDDGSCWWSWGEWWPPSAFGDADIEEAWELTWELPGPML